MGATPPYPHSPAASLKLLFSHALRLRCFHNASGPIFEMADNLYAAIRGACHVYNQLPSNATTIVSGTGIHFFYARTANTMCICPLLLDGTRAGCIDADDVCLTATDARAHQVHMSTHMQLDSNSGSISIAYTLDADAGVVPEEMHVCVHVCGVLLVQVCVRAAYRLADRRALGRYANYVAVHPAGTHLATSDYIFSNCVNVFTLPDFVFVRRLDKRCAARGLCFTDAGTLLVTDGDNDSVQHWALDGSWMTSYPAQKPWCAASCGDVVAVGGTAEKGVRVFSLESNTTISECMQGSSISAVVFVDANTLAVADMSAKTIELRTLEGVLKRHLASQSMVYGLAVCADGRLLVPGYKRIRVFSKAGDELIASSPFAVYAFEARILAVALVAECVYVLEDIEIHRGSHVCVFN
jgi:hypothetical protein